MLGTACIGVICSCHLLLPACRSAALCAFCCTLHHWLPVTGYPSLATRHWLHVTGYTSLAARHSHSTLPPQVLGLMSELLRSPALPEESLALYKAQVG